MASESEIFKALADQTRLRVLNLFLVSGETLCVCEIVDALKVPQYNISKHLNALKYAGIVEVEKEGHWGYYRLKIDESRNRALFTFLKNFLSAEKFQNDKRNLEFRLLLREDGKCVVGFVSENELLKKIKMKTKNINK